MKASRSRPALATADPPPPPAAAGTGATTGATAGGSVPPKNEENNGSLHSFRHSFRHSFGFGDLRGPARSLLGVAVGLGAFIVSDDQLLQLRHHRRIEAVECLNNYHVLKIDELQALQDSASMNLSRLLRIAKIMSGHLRMTIRACTVKTQPAKRRGRCLAGSHGPADPAALVHCRSGMRETDEMGARRSTLGVSTALQG